MKMRALFALAILLVSSAAFAQDATLNSRFGWNQSDSDAPQLTYKHYSDGDTVGVTLLDLRCTQSVAPLLSFDCTSSIPAYTPGPHIVDITAVRVAANGVELESPHSNSISFNMIVSPTAPTNFRIALYINEDGSIVWAVKLPT
jgi:hypothetical protein